MRSILTTAFALLFVTGIAAQETKKKKTREWGIQVAMGYLNYDADENSTTSEGSGDLVLDFSADYYLDRHTAVSGGLFFERLGIFNTYNNGAGLTTRNMAGIKGGIKYYPLNPKWIIQPYIGGMAYINVLNLGTKEGRRNVQMPYYGTAVYDYKLKTTALSVAPQIGCEIRLFSSVSLFATWEYRFGLYGHNNASLRFTEGMRAGHAETISFNNDRYMPCFGLKVDFPMRDLNKTSASVLSAIIQLFTERDNSMFKKRRPAVDL